MSVLVALNVGSDSLEIVTGETSPSGKVRILHLTNVPLPLEPIPTINGTEPHQTEPPVSADQATGRIPLKPSLLQIEQLIDFDIDLTLALLPSQRVLFENVDLPFEDPRKVEKTLPLQIQDLLPFEIEDFIVDSIALGKKDGEQYEYLASLVPFQDVSETLALLARVGVNPKTLTSQASALMALSKLCPDYLSGSYGIIFMSPQRCSMALFIKDSLKHLRELPVHLPVYRDNGAVAALPELARDIRCSIANIEQRSGETFEKLYLLGNQELIQQIGKFLGRPIEMLDISSYVQVEPKLDVSANDIAWAVGLFASELPKPTPLKLINYRQGPFAYRPLLGNLLAAFKEEWYSYTFFALFFFLWVGSVFYASHSALAKLDKRILAEVRQAFPTEKIPEKHEVEFLKDRVEKLEEQLRGIGSLSSLSPLESLNELSEALGPELEVAIDALHLSLTGFRMQGSVGSVPDVGRLQGALEHRKERFCKVQVDPGELIPGGSRVKFKAEVIFSCDQEP